MHIAIVNQFFWPDLSGASSLATDLVRELTKRGVQVTVICGRSVIGGVSDSGAPCREIVRVPGFPFSRSKFARAASSLSFIIGSFSQLLRLRRSVDLVLILTTPPLIPIIGLALKRLSGVPYAIWEMDMYPDVAVDLGVLSPNSVLTRIVGGIMDASRTQAQCVVSLGPCMTKRLLARGIPEARIRCAENWADGSLYRPSPSAGGPRKQITILYPGNAGMAHDVETICGAMECLKDDLRFRFVFVGGGSEMGTIVRFCRSRSIQGAVFEGFKPPSRVVQENFRESDIGLVTQKHSCAGSVVPSKIYGMMGCGLPLLFIGPPNATPAYTIEEFRCGWRIDCGDVRGLVALFQAIARERDLITKAGQRARQAFLDRFDMPAGVTRVCESLGISCASNGVHG